MPAQLAEEPFEVAIGRREEFFDPVLEVCHAEETFYLRGGFGYKVPRQRLG